MERKELQPVAETNTATITTTKKVKLPANQLDTVSPATRLLEKRR